jgi:dTDP-4-amino-4,6-dideoxygalactose transaminase
MITTDRLALAEAMRMLALHGVSHEAWDRYSERGTWQYDVLVHGFKYNLSDIQAALGIHQLHKLDHFIERRTQYARMYQDAFAGMEELEPPPDNPRCRHAWHLYILRLNLRRLKIDRGRFIRELQQRGVGASVHFIPIPLLRFFGRLPLAQCSCPRALDLYPRIVSLPLYPAMTVEQVQYVARSVREICESSRRARFVAPREQTDSVPVGAGDAESSPERCL